MPKPRRPAITAKTIRGLSWVHSMAHGDFVADQSEEYPDLKGDRLEEVKRALQYLHELIQWHKHASKEKP